MLMLMVIQTTKQDPTSALPQREIGPLRMRFTRWEGEELFAREAEDTKARQVKQSQDEIWFIKYIFCFSRGVEGQAIRSEKGKVLADCIF